jgi:hypothetical protein
LPEEERWKVEGGELPDLVWEPALLIRAFQPSRLGRSSTIRARNSTYSGLFTLASLPLEPTDSSESISNLHVSRLTKVLRLLSHLSLPPGLGGHDSDPAAVLSLDCGSAIVVERGASRSW